MTAPLLLLDGDLDAGAFALMHLPTQSDQQDLDIVEDNRRRSWLGKDGQQCFAMFPVHLEMLAMHGINCKQKMLSKAQKADS